MSSKVNGNKFKGKQRGRRARKQTHSDYNENTDSYGKVITGLGERRMSVLLLDDPSGQPVKATIRGIHINKVWYKKDDIVVIRYNGNLYEIQGFANEGEQRRVREEFNKLEGKTEKGEVIFRDPNASDSEESENDKNNEYEKNNNVIQVTQTTQTIQTTQGAETTQISQPKKTKQIDYMPPDESSSDEEYKIPINPNINHNSSDEDDEIDLQNL